ncbi:MAG: helix-turn-helix transcriptional regulator [Candidatus Borkfalkiaceae bacterium]|nr:helix-turn-helix transcriptional regulator [Christensenellaceae bacterium]
MDKNTLHSIFYKIKMDGCLFNFTIDNTYAHSYHESSNEISIKELHSHSEFEWFFVTNDNLQLVTTSREESYSPGVVVCIPPNFQHYSRRKQGAFRLLLSFRVLKNQSNLSRFFSSFLCKKIMFYSLNDSIVNYLKEIEKVSKNHYLYFYEEVSNLLTLIIYEIFSVNSKRLKDSVPKNENYLLKIENTIFNSYSDNPTLSSIANEIFLSPKQVSRIIKKHYNKTFTELLNDRKMVIAAALLLETNKSVTDIISFLNYTTENYFYSLFKKYFGCTPLQYRKNKGHESVL